MDNNDNNTPIKSSDVWDLFWMAVILVQLKAENKLSEQETKNLVDDLFAEDKRMKGEN